MRNMRFLHKTLKLYYMYESATKTQSYNIIRNMEWRLLRPFMAMTGQISFENFHNLWTIWRHFTLPYVYFSYSLANYTYHIPLLEAPCTWTGPGHHQSLLRNGTWSCWDFLSYFGIVGIVHQKLFPDPIIKR